MKTLTRFFLIAFLTVLFLAAGGAVAGYFWINHYLASAEFRGRLSRAASRALGVDGQFESLHWNGLALYSPAFSAQGGPASPVDQLLLQDLHAGLNLAAAFHGVWKVDTIDVGQLQLSLKKPVAAGEAVPVEPAPAKPEEFLPSTFQVDMLRFHSVTVTWPISMAGGGTASGLVFEVRHEGEGWQADSRKGSLTVAALPPLQVERLSMRFRPDRLYLTEASLKNPGGGAFSFSGEAGLGTASDVDLHGEVVAVPVTPFLPADWRARFFGNLFSSWHLTSSPMAAAPWTLEGQAHFEEARLEGLPILDQIATFTQTADYRTLKLQTLSCDYTLIPGQTDLKNLVLESEGLVRIEGGLSCNFTNGGDLSGTEQLGLAASKLSLLPGAQSQVFTETRGLYVWTPVQVGGTLGHPTEDLSPRLKMVVQQAVEQNVQQGVESAVDLFNKLLR